MNFKIPYGRQHITEADKQAVLDTLGHDFLTQGPKVIEFEEKFAQYVGAKYAVAVSNGTAALHLSALALNVNETSNVITTPITFAASANCVRYCGGNVWFADIDPSTALIDIQKVEKLIESKPEGFFSGIIPVDFAGLPVNLEELRKVADKYGLWILEDACHAPGGYFMDSQGKKQNCGNGNFAELAIFSFHPVKHIACGEGGMITTNRKDLYKKLLRLRTHGITKEPDLMQENHGDWYYEMQELGYNYRLPDILASLGVSQLSRANEGIEKRRKIAKRYDEAFANLKNVTPLQLPKNVKHAYHLYIIQIENRLKLYNHLRENGIYVQIHYIPVHTLPYYKSLGNQSENLTNAESYYEKCISLPMYPTLSEAEQYHIFNLIFRKYESETSIY